MVTIPPFQAARGGPACLGEKGVKEEEQKG